MAAMVAKASVIELAQALLVEKTSKSQVARLFAQLAHDLKTTSDTHQQTSMIPRIPQVRATSAQHDNDLAEIMKSASLLPSVLTIPLKTPLSLANATYGETPPETMRTLLQELAAVHNNKAQHFPGRFIDAGSGNGVATVCAALDGRFPRSSGIEYEENRTTLANNLKESYDKQRHTSILDFTCGDLANESLSGASVVFSNSVCFDAALCATVGRSLEEADMTPNAVVVSVSRRFPCPSFDLVDILKMPCNGGDDFSFYICRKHGASIVALSDSATMRGLRDVNDLLNKLISLSTRDGGSNEGLAFLAAVGASEPSTRVLTEHHANVLALMADRLVLSTNSLATRASSSMVLRAISNHPVGRRGIAESDVVLAALLGCAKSATGLDSEHPAILANVLDIIGEVLQDSLGNDKLGGLGIDELLVELLVDAADQDLSEVVQACEEAQSTRRWWGGEIRSVEKWFS